MGYLHVDCVTQANVTFTRLFRQPPPLFARTSRPFSAAAAAAASAPTFPKIRARAGKNSVAVKRRHAERIPV